MQYCLLSPARDSAQPNAPCFPSKVLSLISASGLARVRAEELLLRVVTAKARFGLLFQVKIYCFLEQSELFFRKLKQFSFSGTILGLAPYIHQ